jgi:hypothetical protein
MTRVWTYIILALFVELIAVTPAFAAKMDQELLGVVPPGTMLVSGIADPGHPMSIGYVLISTANTNRDLDDCVALLGVDSNRAIMQILEVASGSQDYNDHLLLLEGRFDRARIFNSAVKNGNALASNNGEELLVIVPFEREKASEIGTRWLAILNQRIVLFGAPKMVAAALLRHASHMAPDPVLLRRIQQLDPDVDSWSVIALDSPGAGKQFVLDTRLEFLNPALERAEAFSIGIHYGRKARICFALQEHGTPEISDESVRAGFLGQAHVPMRGFALQNDSGTTGSVRGSFAIRTKEVGEWFTSLQHNKQLRH